MKDRTALYTEMPYDGVRRLFIFAFFVVGVLLAGETATEIWPAGDILEPGLYLYALSFGALLVLSASVWGTALLPLCSMGFGCITGRYAEGIVRAFWLSGSRDIKGLLVNAVAVPIFFVAAVRGMRSSSMLGAMLDRHSPALRAEYNREYIPLAVTVLTSMMVLYFISH